MAKFYYIQCRIERGAFTNERTFEIDLSDQVRYGGEREGQLVGTAHVAHLRKGNQEAITEDDPSYGEVIRGFVRCRLIRDLPAGWVMVEVPSADVIHVSKSALVSSE